MVKQPFIKMDSSEFREVCDKADLSEESVTD
jgi:hypothetical protein